MVMMLSPQGCECGFDSHSSPEIFFQEKKNLRTCIQVLSIVMIVIIVPLNGTNYPTWKVQCRMALVRDGLWDIIAGTEAEPPAEEAARRSKFSI